MANRWSPDDVIRLIIAVNVCLCLIIIVGGVMYGILNGVISPENLGYIEIGGVGTGLLAFMYILYRIIKILPFGGTNR